MRVMSMESYICTCTRRDSAHVALPQLRRLELIGIAPGVLFYALYYMAWPGYILGILAVSAELGVKSIARMPRPAAIAKIRETRDLVE